METIHSVRIEHGTSTNNGMAYSQRSQPIHRIFSKVNKYNDGTEMQNNYQVKRPPQSGGDNGPPPHKQARTALSPPASRAPPTGYAISPYVPSTHHSPRDTLLGYSIYPTRGDQPSIYRASPAQQPPIEYLQQQQRSSAANMRAPPQQQSQQPPPQQQQPPPEMQPHVVRTLPPPSSQDPHRQQEQHGVVNRGGVNQGIQQSPVGVVQSQPPDHMRSGGNANEHMRLQPQQSDHMRDHNVPRNVVTEHIRSSVEQQHNAAAVSHRLSQEHVRNSQEVVRIDGITREQLSQSQLRPRISLLSSSTDYITAQNMALRRDMYRQDPVGLVAAPTANIVSVGPTGHVQLDMTGGSPAYKKIRLGEQKPDLQPLRIDTREQSGTYNPQVEAISPTPNDHGQDDLVFRSTKDDLLQQISRVDREIAKVESSIHNLKKKQHELEEAASKPAGKQEVEEVLQPKHQSLAQKIYAENRRKAQAAHSFLDNLGSKVDWPLYNQPSDTTVYSENKRKHQTFKPRLLEYFKKRHTEKEQRETYLTQTYSKLMQEWLKKVDKIESSQKRKGKEAKNREFFEKVFPELRKQREDKERFNRVGARIKSEADLEEIMDGLQEQELEDKKMRSYAVIPPILLDARQRKLCYSNNNGHILDMESEYKERALINVWTNSEKEIFKEKYLQHPKNFGLIASFLDRKSVQDCVQHYYLSKKTENYKQLLRKSRQRTRSSRNNPQKVNNAANNSLGDIALSTGVTTRLQREQQQKIVASTPVTSVPTTSTASSSIITNNVSSSSSSTEATTTVVNTSVSSTIAPSSSTTTSTTSVLTSTVNTSVTTSSSSSATNSTTSAVPPCSTSLSNSLTTTQVTCNSSNSSASNTNCSVTTTTTTGSTTQPVLVSATASTVSAVTSEDVNKNKTLTVITTSSSSLSNSLSGGLVATTISSSIPPSSAPTSSNSIALSSSSSTMISSVGISSSNSSSNNNNNNCTGVQSVTTVTSSVTTPVVSNVLLLPSSVTSSSSNSTVLSSDLQNTTNSSISGTDNLENIQENKLSSDNTSNTPSNTTIVEKKKKDRRKDKEQQAVETSDEEAPDNQEKGSVPHSCVVCKTELEQYLQSRPLLASHASQYGLHPEQIGPDARVCNTCRCKCVRTRYTHCPLPTCGHHARGRVKRLRTMPSRWMELPQEIWQSAVQEFQIPQSVTKCCSACFNRISRRLAPHLPPSGTAAGSPGAAWGEEERTKLRTLLSEHGAHWALISERLNRPIHQIKNFYLDQRKRLGLDTLVAEYNRTHHGDERKPVLTDEEESGSSTSSCEEITEINSRERLSSDTTSANSPPETSGMNQPELRPTKPDYDSSATETADEGQAVEVEQRQNYSQATITVVNGPVNPVTARGAENASPMTVKDLMLNVIEKQLMKNQGGNNPPVSGVNVSGITPTISSILKSETQDITFVREFKSRPTQQNQPQENTSLATLSVVNSTHGGAPTHHIGPQQSPVQVLQQQQPPGVPPQQIQIPTHVAQVPHVGQIAATITPVPPPGSQHSNQQQQVPPQQQEFLRGGEGLVVVQVQQALREREPEPVTLDLSIKRPRDPNPQATQLTTPKLQQQHPMYRPASIEQYYHHQKTPPSVYVSAIPHRQKTPTQQQNHQSPKPANPKSGSITLGTPVQQQSQQMQSQAQSQQQRYDGLLRQMTPPPKMGSITQGTPIHLPGGGHHMQQDKRAAYDYYAKRQSPTVQANYTTSSSARPPQSYSMEQQLSSRQIIMNDYITSQQMQVGASRRNEKSQESPRGPVGGGGNQVVTSNAAAAAAALYYENQYITNRTPPPTGPSAPPPPPPPQRQGVIQRHHRPSPPPPQQQQQQQRRNYAPLAGHEAFSSLVDVAVRQPQLPVPNTTHKEGGGGGSQQSGGGGGHEGLGKTIADHTHRYSQLSAMHQQQRRMVELNRQQHLYQQQQQQQHNQQHNQQSNQHHNQHHQQQSNQQPNQHHQQSNQHHNQQPSHHQQQSNQQQQQQQQSASSHHQQNMNRNEPSTLTAASLIDAIITHQINQCGDTNTIPRGGDANMQQSRPGDRLFQGFHNPSVLENNNGNHHHHSPGGPSGGGIINVDLDSENSPQQKLTVKDFADSVINRDFSASGGGPPRGQQQYYQHKPPTVADERQIIRVAQQKQYHASPPPPRPTSYSHSQPHSHLSAFDYMKHRIVEVMRTEDDKRDDQKTSDHKSSSTGGGVSSADSPGEMVIDESKQQQHESTSSSSVTPTNFASQPFAAYSYNTMVGQHNVVNKVDITTSSSNETNSRQAEPKPLMSAQYEPLSDED